MDSRGRLARQTLRKHIRQQLERALAAGPISTAADAANISEGVLAAIAVPVLVPTWRALADALAAEKGAAPEFATPEDAAACAQDLRNFGEYFTRSGKRIAPQRVSILTNEKTPQASTGASCGPAGPAV